MNTKQIQKVQQYKEQKLAVLPIPYKGKSPIIAGWSNRTVDDCSPEAEFSTPQNVGIVLGNKSNGLVDIDLDNDTALGLAHYFLPDTDMVFGRKSKPESHHVYKVMEGIPTKKFQCGGVIVEIRSDGAQTVFPPSTHQSGESIEFSKDGNPREISAEELERSVSKLAGATILAENWKEGIRHDLTMAVAGMLLKSARWDAGGVNEFINAVCEVAGDTEIKDREKAVSDTLKNIKEEHSVKGFLGVVEILGDDVAKKLSEWLVGGDDFKPMHHESPSEFYSEVMEADKAHTDTGNGQKFFEQYKQHARFVTDIGCWIAWDGKKWKMDDDAAIRRFAHRTADSLYNEVSRSFSRDNTYQWAKQSHNNARINAMIAEAKPYLGLENNALDRNPWLLNCNNGIVNLKTGEVQLHGAEHFITQYADVAYRADTFCPKFQAFLDRIFDNDKDVIGFVQRALGSSIAGLDARRHLFIAHGDGSNGKSTLLETVQDILGDYVCTTPVSSLMSSATGSGINNDIARLRGKRMVLASEGERQNKLAEAQIKRLTGGDTITARFLNKEFFEFKPVCDFWLATNHKPKISGNDPAIWNRVFLIPFEVTIPDDEKNPNLKNELLAEKEGILAWLVKGCIDWHTDGLNAPEKVKAATQSYKGESDSVGQYLEESTERTSGIKTTKTDLYISYSSWCELNGHEKLIKKDFGQVLISRGIEDGKSGRVGHFWKDISIIRQGYDPSFEFDEE